jgi:hypothetical protein
METPSSDANATAPTNDVTAPTNGAAPLSDDEIRALADAAREHLPSLPFIGKPLNFAYKTGRWFVKVSSEQEEEVGATQIFIVDLRSYGDSYRRWANTEHGKRTVTDTIGGRRIDGWRNPSRNSMPETDESEWDDNGDPWQPRSQIVLRRQSDGQLLTFAALYGARQGIAELVDIATRECRDHIGRSPVVLLESVSDGKNFKPRLRIVGWEPFGDGASPPADPANGTRLREQLEELLVKYAAPKAAIAGKKASKRGDMDDETPF